MATITRYEDIVAWQEGRALVKAVYATTAKSPFVSDYGLKDQIRRAAVSVCSNIAEGFDRRGNREFVRFLWIAKGSSAEVSSQLYNALDLGYISKEEFESLFASSKKICEMLHCLIKSIKDIERKK